MRSLLLCVLVACSSQPDSTGFVGMLEVPPPSPAIVRPPSPPPPRPPLVARSSGVLRTLATIDDANLAVTTDNHGELRYWPSLDGRREPVIVPVNRPAIATTVIHAKDGLAILSRDGLGQLELIRIALDGTWLSSVDVALARPVTACAATSSGFIALRDDQVIEGIDPSGQVFGDIAPDPGTRVTSFLQRNGHVLALFAGYQFRGQFIEIDDDSISWGKRTAAIVADDEFGFALSPDGTRIAAARAGTPMVFDLETGKRKATCAARSATIIAWKDDATVLFASGSVTYDWSIERKVPDTLIEDLLHTQVAGSAMVQLGQRSLVVYSNAKVRELGYRLGQLGDLVATPNGWIGTNGLMIARFDRELHFDRDLHIAIGPNVVLVDARHYANPDPEGFTRVFTIGSDAPGTELPLKGYNFELDRSSGLAINETSDSFQFMHWDATRGAFSEGVATLPKQKRNTELVHLYDPDLSDGVVAELASIDGYANLRTTKFRAIAPGAAQPFRSATSEARHASSDNFDTVLAGALPDVGVVARTGDGTLIAELAANRMSLRDRDGNVRWIRTSRGATGLAWNAGNELVAFGAGLAEVDQDTGDFIDPHCGWQFGLWSEALDASGSSAMCTGGDQHADVAFEPEVIEDETP